MAEANGKATAYVARQPDKQGVIDWTESEHRVWQTLISRQQENLPGRACDAYLAGLRTLDLPGDRIPQLGEVSRVLQQTTGWTLAPVPALISFDEFFRLLSERQFPVATFIRRPQELDYLQEPDIFHEIFGHCPMLTHPAFAQFTHLYGRLGYQANARERVYLARLYWFTVEFGLCQSPQGLRIYGGGILSSPGETRVALDSQRPERRPLDILDALRTPYRIDIMQPIYFVLDSIEQLYAISKLDIMDYVHQAMTMGLHQPRFEPVSSH